MVLNLCEFRAHINAMEPCTASYDMEYIFLLLINFSGCFIDLFLFFSCELSTYNWDLTFWWGDAFESQMLNIANKYKIFNI